MLATDENGCLYILMLLSKISSNFTLHLIKVGKLKRLRKFQVTWKWPGFLSFKKDKTCQSILIMSHGKTALS